MGQVHTATHQGPRENLEDRALALHLAAGLAASQITILIVCDGVGGSAKGERAAALGVTVVGSCLAGFFAQIGESIDAVSPDDVLTAMERALESANDAVVHDASQSPDRRGMASTIVIAIVIGSTLFIAWAGDSRCYVIGGHGWARAAKGTRECGQITRDHSEAQRLADAGLIEPREATHHPLSHTIYRFLGQTNGFHVETRVVGLHDGDRVLLCSDGLSDALTDERITEIVRGTDDDARCADTLVEAALAAGTTDNVTAVVCQPDVSARNADLFHRTLTGGYAAELAITWEHLLTRRTR